MAKELQRNVNVEGVWYGPDYPDAKPSQAVLDKIDNPAAFEPLDTGIDLNDRSGPEELGEDDKAHRASSK